MRYSIPCLLLLALPLQAQGVLYSFGGVPDSVAGCGDVNGDGVPDLIVGLRARDTNGYVGRVELRSGASGALIHALDQAGIADAFGHAVAGVGDLDGDGSADFALSAPLGALNLAVSRVRVHSGATGLVLREWLDTDRRVSFGHALAGGVDLGGDGVPEVLVGAPRYFASEPGPGRVVVFDGASGLPLRVHHGTGPSAVGFGSALAFVGDLDQDGVAEYAVGSGRSGNGGITRGAVTVFSGATGAVLWHVEGAVVNGAFGSSLAALEDIDGDGVGELVAGSPGEFQANFVTGAARVLSGANGAQLHHLTQPFGIQLGSSVHAVGDVDGDGVADFGAHYPLGYVGGVIKNVGTIVIASGADGSVLDNWTQGYTGPVAPAGDVNLDGVPDFLIGGGVAAPGFASLVLGRMRAVEISAGCLGKVNSAGCHPGLTWSGGPSLGTGPGLTLTASGLLGQQTGLFVHGAQGAPTPFQGGTLCVAPPRLRSAAVSTGGTSGTSCDGSLGFTFDGALLVQLGLTIGATHTVQAWSRDPGFPPGQDSSLTWAVQFTVWP